MGEAATPLELASVDAGQRGEDIRERRKRLGLNTTELGHEAHVGRGLVSKIERGDPSVREANVLAVERALDNLERYAQKPPAAVDEAVEDVPVRVFEFEIEGEVGRFIGRLPSSDPAEIERIVAAIARGLKASQDETSEG